MKMRVLSREELGQAEGMGDSGTNEKCVDRLSAEDREAIEKLLRGGRVRVPTLRRAPNWTSAVWSRAEGPAPDRPGRCVARPRTGLAGAVTARPPLGRP